MTFTQLFASKIADAISTKDISVICKEMICVFEQAKTFHQFHEAWLKFEGFKYFQYSQNHHQDTFNVFIENSELNDEESENFGLNLYLVFGHDYRTQSTTGQRIDYAKVINEIDLPLNEFDLSRFSSQ